MQLNNILDNLVDDMKEKMKVSNDYSTTPTIHKGSGTTNVPLFPFIEVMAGDPEIEDFIGGATLLVKVPITFTSFTKAQQKDKNDYDHNNIIEDVLQYVINDCVYKNDMSYEEKIECFNSELDRGDAFFASIITVNLKIEYNITQINQ